MGNSGIKRRILSAETTRSCHLDHKGLRQIPDLFQTLAENLTYADLSYNKLDDLRPLKRFLKLRYLNASNNRLLQLPDLELTGLRKLHSFILNNNFLFHLPSSFANMSSLVEINLANNRFQIFPVELCLLPKLEILDLSGNSLTKLPSMINKIQTIEINLSQNRLSDLCSIQLSECLRLRVLRLEDNDLGIHNFLPNFLEKSKISFLSISGNNFEETEFCKLPGYYDYQQRYTAAKEVLAIPP